MSSCRIVIPITPKAKASVRMARGRHYNPSAKGMNQVTNYIKKQFQGEKVPLLKGPLLVVVHFVLPAPLSVSKTRREQLNCRPMQKKPDGDNLEKFLNDALTGYVWDDDARVVWMLRSKTITIEKEGYTVFYAEEIPDAAPDYLKMLKTIEEQIYIHKGV